MPKRMPEVVVDPAIEVAAALMDVDGRQVLIVNPRSGTFDSLLAAACQAVPDVHPDQVQVALRVAVGNQMPEAAPPILFHGTTPRFTVEDAKAAKREAHLIVAVGLAISLIIGAALASFILVFARANDNVKAETVGLAGNSKEADPLWVLSPLDAMRVIGPALNCVGLRPAVYRCTHPDGSVLIGETYVGPTALRTMLTTGTEVLVIYTFTQESAAESWQDSAVAMALPEGRVVGSTLLRGSNRLLVDLVADALRTRNGGDEWPVGWAPGPPADEPRPGPGGTG